MFEPDDYEPYNEDDEEDVVPADYDDWPSIKKVEFHFPELAGGKGYRDTSKASIDYNCLAWALGIDWAHYNPTPRCAGYIWFPGVPRRWDLDTISQIFQNHGYTPCDTYAHEQGFEKVAFYINHKGKPQHFARQLLNGNWTSKLGSLNDIEHENLESLVGPDGYHKLERVFKRRLR